MQIVDDYLIKDVQAFLDYIGDRQLSLTQTSFLKLKDISLISDLFIWPGELTAKLQSEFIERARSEREVKYLHFIRVLCHIAGLVKIRHKKISTTAKTKKFLHQNNDEQLAFLFSAWFSKLNWNYFTRTDTDILEHLQEERLSFLFNLQLLKGNSIPFDVFTKVIANHFPLADIKSDSQVEFEVQLFISYLKYFGAVEMERKKGKYGFNEDYAFLVTTSGQKLFKQELRKFGIEADLAVRTFGPMAISDN